MISLIIIGIIQALFLPGILVLTIMSKTLNLKFSIADKIIISTPLSIVINYLLVFSLSEWGIYKQGLILSIILLEMIVLALFISKNSLRSQEEQATRQIFFIKENQLEFIFLGLASSCLIVAYIPTFGMVFQAWDAIASWNFWAESWFKGIPCKSMGYPQALPFLFSIVYICAGDSNLQTFAKIVSDYFPFFGLLCFFRMATIDSKYKLAYASGGFVFVLTLVFGNPIISNFAFSGYVDAPMAALAAFMLYSIVYLNERKKSTEDGRIPLPEIGVLMIAAASLPLTKQSGVCAILLYSLIILWKHRDSIIDKKIPFFLAMLSTGIISSFWYVYSYFRWNDYVRYDFLMQEPLLLRPEAGFILITKAFGLVLITLFFASALTRGLPSLIFACLISPLFLFWSYLVSYDLRTAFIFYPWLAFLAGVSIYSIRKTGKIGIFLVFFVLFLIIAENNVKLPQIEYWTKSISLFLLLFLIINALTYLIETHSRYILTFYNSQKMRYSLVILLVVTLLVLPSVFSHKNILDANNDLRISCNDQGFNRKIYQIFQNEPKSILVSEWVTLKNLPGSVDHFWGAQPKDAPEIWISKPAVKYYLHWSNHPLSLAPEIVRQMASSSGLKYEEEKLHPNFILFKKI